MNISFTRRTKINIASVVAVAVLAAGIACAVIFWPKPHKTRQEWLNDFSTSFERAVSATDAEGTAVPINIVREIEIKENGETVAVYK